MHYCNLSENCLVVRPGSIFKSGFQCIITTFNFFLKNEKNETALYHWRFPGQMCYSDHFKGLLVLTLVESFLPRGTKWYWGARERGNIEEKACQVQVSMFNASAAEQTHSSPEPGKLCV